MSRASFKIALLVLVSIVAAPVAATPEAEFSGETSTLTVNLTASGVRTALKLDDETCQFGFIGLVEDPEIEVVSNDGAMVDTIPLGTGDWSMAGDVAICQGSFQAEVPATGSFTLIIAPYFTSTYSLDDIPTGIIAIDMTRYEGDPFPISPIPAGGLIEGTEDVRIVGHFELFGTQYEDYGNGPFGCMGMGGYRDIQAGMQVTIKNEEGTIIGISEMLPDPLEDRPSDCKFYFVAEVPVSEFYTFESGRRGSITYSHNDLEEADWTIYLSMG